MPNLYMIAGPNGAGKTTSAMELLPEILDCKEYINADAIAAGLSPFQPDVMAFKAGRLMLERIHELARYDEDFAFETTGASKTFLPFLRYCKNRGYKISILYFWVHTPELAIERVADRVKRGGHNIPEKIIRRRYPKSIKNFFNLYLSMADEFIVCDNSSYHPTLIAEKKETCDIIILNENIWNMLRGISQC
jgi:predicted ABC-type ATPase